MQQGFGQDEQRRGDAAVDDTDRFFTEAEQTTRRRSDVDRG